MPRLIVMARNSLSHAHIFYTIVHTTLEIFFICSIYVQFRYMTFVMASKELLSQAEITRSLKFLYEPHTTPSQ